MASFRDPRSLEDQEVEAALSMHIDRPGRLPVVCRKRDGTAFVIGNAHGEADAAQLAIDAMLGMLSLRRSQARSRKFWEVRA